MPYAREYVNAKQYLTQEERNEMAMSLAEKHIDITNLEEEKKGVVAEFKAKIDIKKAEISLASTHIKDGYITKTIHAEKKKNFRMRRWEWVDPETGEVIKKEAFSGSDYQRSINDEDEEPPFGDAYQEGLRLREELSGLGVVSITNSEGHEVVIGNETDDPEEFQSDEADSGTEELSEDPETDEPKKGRGRPRKDKQEE